MKYIKHLLVIVLFGAVTVFATSWSGTSTIRDGQVISANVLKNNFDHLYARTWDFLNSNDSTFLSAGDKKVAAVEYCDETGKNCFTGSDIVNILNEVTVEDNSLSGVYHITPVVKKINAVWNKSSYKRISSSKYSLDGWVVVPEGVNMVGSISPQYYGSATMYAVSPGDRVPMRITYVDHETQSGNQYWKWYPASVVPSKNKIVDSIFMYSNSDGYAVKNGSKTKSMTGSYTTVGSGSIPKNPGVVNQPAGLPFFWKAKKL